MASLSELSNGSYSHVHNGYCNPYRSTKLNEWLERFSDVKKSWEVTPRLSCTESRERMVHFARMILITGVLIAAATLVEGMLFHAHPLASFRDRFTLVMGGGSTMTLCCFLVASALIDKPYWKDPAYRQREREKIIQRCIDGKFQSVEEDKERWEKYELFTKAEEQVLSLDRIYSYSNTEKSYPTECIEIDPHATLTPSLLSEIRSHCNGELSTYVEMFGWQPFRRGLLEAQTRLPLPTGIIGEAPTLEEYFIASIERDVREDFNDFAARTFDWEAFDPTERATPCFYGLIAADNPHLINGFFSYLRECASKKEGCFSFTYYCDFYHEIACALKWINEKDKLGKEIQTMTLAYWNALGVYSEKIRTMERDAGCDPSLSKEGQGQDKKNEEKSLTVKESLFFQGGVLQTNLHIRPDSLAVTANKKDAQADLMKQEELEQARLMQKIDEINSAWEKVVMRYPDRFSSR